MLFWLPVAQGNLFNIIRSIRFVFLGLFLVVLLMTYHLKKNKKEGKTALSWTFGQNERSARNTDGLVQNCWDDRMKKSPRQWWSRWWRPATDLHRRGLWEEEGGQFNTPVPPSGGAGLKNFQVCWSFPHLDHRMRPVRWTGLRNRCKLEQKHSQTD